MASEALRRFTVVFISSVKARDEEHAYQIAVEAADELRSSLEVTGLVFDDSVYRMLRSLKDKIPYIGPGRG